jgi:hypothetical protein
MRPKTIALLNSPSSVTICPTSGAASHGRQGAPVHRFSQSCLALPADRLPAFLVGSCGVAWTPSSTLVIERFLVAPLESGQAGTGPRAIIHLAAPKAHGVPQERIGSSWGRLISLSLSRTTDAWR